MNFILHDNPVNHKNLLPLSATRPISAFRVGILTISEKWEHYLGKVPAILTEPYLQKKFPQYWHPDNLVINSALCPEPILVKEILSLKSGEALYHDNTILAARASDQNVYKSILEGNAKDVRYFLDDITCIEHPWDVFGQNGAQILHDFELLTKGRMSEKITEIHSIAYNPERIFLEPGAKVKAAILDAENGPIYLGKNTVVHPGAIIQGPIALCEGSHVNPGAKIKGDTTIGPYSKIGGEVSNSVIIGYSNKGHDGFMGNSVLGEWCNLGADTNSSNLKNNYANVRVWNYPKNNFIDSGRQFVGLIMGDHSKSGINTMFNTGTVVGVGCNVYGAGFPPKFIPDFSWGGHDSPWMDYNLEKLYEVESRMMVRRSKELTQEDKNMLQHLFDVTKKFRGYE